MTRGVAFEDKLGSLTSFSEVVDAFDVEIKALGYNYFDIGSVDLNRVSEGPGSVRYFLSNYVGEEYVDYLPRNWPIGDVSIDALSNGLGPIDYLELLKASKRTVTTSVQLGLMSLWNIRHAWVMPYNSQNHLRFVTVYMKGKSQAARFMSTRDTLFALGAHAVRKVEEILQSDAKSGPISDQATYDFTAEELACLSALLTGASNPEIARQLNLSPDTVKYHLKKVYRKLGVKTRIEAATKAQNLGVMPHSGD